MEQLKNQLNKNKIIAIIRNVENQRIGETVEALFRGGIRFMEVTFDQSGMKSDVDICNAIKIACEKFGNRAFIGAGTVMTVSQANMAVDAGAKYIISPITNKMIIERTNKINALSIPGALSPTEVVQAYEHGADYVKLFPAGVFGVSYINAVRSPINHIPMIAVGGINKENLQGYLQAGIEGVGIGSNLVDTKLINDGRYEELCNLAKEYTVQV